MGKAKKMRSTSHKKQVPPTGGLSQAELEADNDLDYSTMQADEAEMFRGVRSRWACDLDCAACSRVNAMLTMCFDFECANYSL